MHLRARARKWEEGEPKAFSRLWGGSARGSLGRESRTRAPSPLEKEKKEGAATEEDARERGTPLSRVASRWPPSSAHSSAVAEASLCVANCSPDCSRRTHTQKHTGDI